ncbi:MAG: hypothetical protein RIR25_1748, partial [Verrucomicrobiota bacterium]
REGKIDILTAVPSFYLPKSTEQVPVLRWEGSFSHNLVARE